MRRGTESSGNQFDPPVLPPVPVYEPGGNKEVIKMQSASITCGRRSRGCQALEGSAAERAA